MRKTHSCNIQSVQAGKDENGASGALERMQGIQSMLQHAILSTPPAQRREACSLSSDLIINGPVPIGKRITILSIPNTPMNTIEILDVVLRG